MNTVISDRAHKDWTQWILPIALLIYPFHIKSALFLLLVYLFTSSWPFNSFNLHKHNRLLFLFWPVLLYVIYLISLACTDNIQHGFKDLETKAGLIIFPLIAYFLPRGENEIRMFKTWFVISCVISCLVLLGKSAYSYFSDYDSTVFYYDRFSSLMHPTYFTMYLTLALLLTIEKLCSSDHFNVRSITFLNYSILVLLVISMFLASSRAGIVIGWLVIICILLYLAMLKRPKVLTTMLTFVSAVIASVILLSPPDSRFAVLFNEITGTSDTVATIDSTKVDATPISHRMLLYRSGITLAMENPIGVGVGDVQDELVEVYREIGYEKAAEVRYNPHNQFLQTAVAVGWPGLVVLIMCFVSLLLYSFRNDLMPLTGLILILTLNGMFESVFEVQRGVLFYGIPLLFLVIPCKNEPIKQLHEV